MSAFNKVVVFKKETQAQVFSSGRLLLPGASSKKLLHYIDPVLVNGFYNTTVVHVGINDLLQQDLLARVENLLSNLKSGSRLSKEFVLFASAKPFKIGEKCFLFHHKSSLRSQDI